MLAGDLARPVVLTTRTKSAQNSTGSLTLSPRLTVTVLQSVTQWAKFRLHSRVAFASTDHGSASGVRFLAISLAGYALNLALLTVLVDTAGLPQQIAQLSSLVLIALMMFQ